MTAVCITEDTGEGLYHCVECGHWFHFNEGREFIEKWRIPGSQHLILYNFICNTCDERIEKQEMMAGEIKKEEKHG